MHISFQESGDNPGLELEVARVKPGMRKRWLRIACRLVKILERIILRAFQTMRFSSYLLKQPSVYLYQYFSGANCLENERNIDLAPFSVDTHWRALYYCECRSGKGVAGGADFFNRSWSRWSGALSANNLGSGL